MPADHEMKGAEVLNRAFRASTGRLVVAGTGGGAAGDERQEQEIWNLCFEEGVAGQGRERLRMDG